MDQTMLLNYKKLKKESDAAYTLFKKSPDSGSALARREALQRFRDFCVESMAQLAIEAGFREKPVSDEQILKDIEKYRSCEKCDTTLVLTLNDGRLITQDSFVPEFPGWCHNCLLEHCMQTECSNCAVIRRDCVVAKTVSHCPYKEIKEIALTLSDAAKREKDADA
jgi:hypothetical protein